MTMQKEGLLRKKPVVSIRYGRDGKISYRQVLPETFSSVTAKGFRGVHFLA